MWALLLFLLSRGHDKLVVRYSVITMMFQIKETKRKEEASPRAILNHPPFYNFDLMRFDLVIE